jgi:membrane fusion protein (multidrug efflux system)
MTRQLSFAVLLSIAACGRPPAPEAPGAAKSTVVIPPVKVSTVAVEKQPMPRYLTLTGSVFADRQSEVAANVSGRIAATYVERGKSVKAGDILAVVDSKAAGFSAAAATAQSQAAETQVELARQECARADTLFAQGAIAKSEFDRLKTTCTSQLYQANAARANADLAGKLAGDTVIRAPIDGMIGERYVNIGEYVQPATKVASIFAINPARVSISVPEQAVALVKENQTLDVRVSAFERTFPAVVRYISPALRPTTRDLIVEAFALNAEGALRPGMFATVQLLVGEEEQATVPRDAIKFEGTVKRLFLARDGHAFELVVRTGVEKDGRVAVLEPLGQEDKVIVNPPASLRDGSSIQ